MRAAARLPDGKRCLVALAGVFVLGTGACMFELEPPLNGNMLPRPIVLATSQADPWAMAVDATHVYWTNQSVTNSSAGSVVRVPKDAAERATVLARSQAPNMVTVDDTHVFWTTRINSEGRVVKRLKTGTTNESIITGLDDPMGITVDADFIYWTDVKRGGVYKRAKNDNKAPIVELASGQMKPWLIVLGGEFVYWTNRDGRSVMRTRKDGMSAPEMLAPALWDVFGIAVDDTAVFFRDAEQNGAGRVMKFTLATRQLQQLASTSGEGARFLSIDETSVYWTNGSDRDGAIMTALKDGSGMTAIITSLPGPRGLAVDNNDVFWSNYGGATIMKIEKPRRSGGTVTSRGVP
ncbi:MAG TPA: hypothetical protein VGF45_13965 [Polyangia bacterium]